MKGEMIDFLFASFREYSLFETFTFPNRYVDEVQDNLLIDAKRAKSSDLIRIDNTYCLFVVLRAICRNPDGQFWAGDTAQTISVGSSFRFDDLKAFLYRNEAGHFHVSRITHLMICFFNTGKSETAIRWNDRATFAKVFPTCHKLPFARRDCQVCSLGHNAYHEILALRHRHLA